MKKTMILVAALAAACAHSAEPSALVSQVHFHEMADNIRLVKAERCGREDAEFTTCLDPVMEQLSADYAKLNKLLKTPKQKDLLKDHIINTRAALKGFNPAPGERDMDYRRRTGDLRSKVSLSWERFALEAE